MKAPILIALICWLLPAPAQVTVSSPDGSVRFALSSSAQGHLDMLAAMKAYRDAGFNGPFVSDHTPEIEGDDRGGRMGRSFSFGYIRALVEAANAMS